jgi:diguanylate cyclase (GGDEF)-like protein
MIDIDLFKQYNDHYGHVRGDECLKRVAMALRAGASRPRDFIARYGGEEFVLVLPETDAAGAERVVARCRDAVAREQIAHERSTVGSVVTISAGTGTIVPTEDSSLLAFIDSVDRCLYRAKQAGRNRNVALGA